MTNAILRGKPDAGNPHVRFDEGEVASAKPRRGSLLYRMSDLRRRLLLRNEPSAKGRIDVGRRQRVHLPATVKGIGERLLASFPRPPKS